MQRTQALTSPFKLGWPKLALSAACLAAVVAQGCVVEPLNWDEVDARAVDFSGYAQRPGATIQVQAFDPELDDWVTLATTVSRTGYETLDGGKTKLYYWSIDDVDTYDRTRCVWGELSGSTCWYIGDKIRARFRVVEVGSTLEAMTTYEQDGILCVMREVNADNKSWLDAGYMCKSDIEPVLVLQWEYD